ncbi:hypothetical protein HYW55_05500 [Candidatus Gottesmanbacteria bacterium]|nr:hypothetical protein [Candidatus Gottesmanbacteria bacterium]
MNEGKAVSPASISFIFKVCKNRQGEIVGSIGVGATIDKSVMVAVKKSTQLSVYFNGESISFPTVETVVQKLTKNPVEISVTSEVPLACGFGVSGASSIATAYALNALFQLGKDPDTLANIAHTAEIENRTGLGSVATQITGGFLVKRAPAIPVDAVKLPLLHTPLFALVLEKYETAKILNDQHKTSRINRAAEKALRTITSIQNLGISKILDISYEYAIESGILENSEVQLVIEKVKRQGGHATMAMIGHTVFSTIPPPDYFGGNVYSLRISKTIAHIL